jgi:diacylglycerol kinase family enzyme
VRVLVIDNPRAGLGGAGLYTCVQELVSAGADVTVRPFAEPGSLPGLLTDAASYDRVIAAGGDGTASAIAYALRDRRTPLLVYPAGTANLLSANLGLPYDPFALARMTLDGRTRRTDLGEITPDGAESVGFAIMAGAGFDARVMEDAAEMKPTLGAGAYFLSVMRNLMPTVADFRIWLDGDLLATDGIAVIVINFAKITFDLAVAHESDATDGKLEVAVLRTRHVAGLIPAVWQAVLDRLGTVRERSGLEIHQAREIRVESDPSLPMQYDGEVENAVTPFTARVLPGAADFIVER